jgi:hypothetical protein
MKLKAYLLGLVLLCFASCEPAYADPGPQPKSLPVELTYRTENPISAIDFAPTTPAPVFRFQDPDPNPVPTGWSGAYLLRFTGEREDRTAFGALKNITTLSRGSLTISLDGFAGLSLEKSVPVAAILAGWYYQAFDRLTIGFHTGPIMQGGHPAGWSGAISANLRF